ncbi:MAG: hypothetical protein ABJC04_06205, partial [Verrucomicrobiota bacterium]
MKIIPSKTFNSFCALALGAFCLAGEMGVVRADSVPEFRPVPSTMLNVDYRALVSRADIVYDKLVPRPEEGFPMGNGSMGGLIWLTTNGIEAQINRPDVFGNNSYTGLPGGGELGYG